jgi:hypothetical protein
MLIYIIYNFKYQIQIIDGIIIYSVGIKNGNEYNIIQ